MTNERPVCSYESKCYRRNPEHFRLVEHPHLDDLLLGSVDDKPINLPDILKFQCNNRTLLRDQLEILRKIKRERLKNLQPTKSVASSSQTNPPIIDLSNDPEENQDIQKKHDAKEERNTKKRPLQAEILKMMGSQAPNWVPKPGGFLKKYESSSPFNIFFTAVQKNKDTWRQSLSVTFSEILDKSLGEIVTSMHFSFVVNIGWLCMQYLLAEQKSEMIVCYNHREDEDPVTASIQLQEVKSPYNFGSHHTKMSMLQYKDNGVRIIVSSANLYADDWDLRTQGLWISPHLPQLPHSARDEDGESRTGFKADLIRYLSIYVNNGHDTSKWLSILFRTDFSSVNVFFVASIPGIYQSEAEASQWGHRRLSKILQNHAVVPEGEKSTIIATASSVGYLGPSYNNWLSTDIIASMSKATNQSGKPIPILKLMYPTIENYKKSYDLAEGANCLSYHELTHAKQKWIKEHMYQWIASKSNRSSAMPHMKTFLRLSADERRVSWLVLGSANLSKAAWGYRDKGNYKILSYEAGVVFLPKFLAGETNFPITADSTPNRPTLPIPFDIPLTGYSQTDEPYLLLA